MSKIDILYLCNGKRPGCSGSIDCLKDCKHTTDIKYAKNFVKDNRRPDYAEVEYWEKEESDEHGQ